MAGEVAAAAISAAAHIGSQIYNSTQAGNLNAANRKWQELQMQKQRSWALEDWYKQSQQQRALLQMSQDWDAAEWTRRFNEENAYNDPARQMARLRAAGINPYYALGLMDNGAASGAAGPGVSAPAAPAVRQSQFAPNLEQKYAPIDLGASVDRFTDSLLRQEQVKSAQLQNTKQSQENAFNVTRYQYELNKMAFHDKELKAQMPYINQLVDLNWRQANATYENTIANTASLYTTQETQRQNVSLSKMQFEMAKELQQFNMRENLRLNDATLEQIAHTIASIDQSIETSKAQAALFGSQSGYYKALTGTEYVNTVYRSLETYGLRLDNYHKARLNPLLREHQRIQNESDKFNEPNWWTKYGQPNMGSLMQGLGLGAGIFMGLRSGKAAGSVVKPQTWQPKTTLIY